MKQRVFLAAVLSCAALPDAAQGVEFRVTERLTVKQGLEVSTSATASPLLFISSTAGAGNVGIGTSGPNVRLDVSSNAFVRGVGGFYNNPGAAELQIGYGFGIGGTAGSVSRLALQPYGHTGGPWKFVARDDASKAYLDWVYGAAAAGLTQDSSGNVGIGTTSPIGKLHIAGSHASGIMTDTNDRPSVGATGTYPQLVLMSGNSGNASHGATVMLGGYDVGASGAHKHWSMGTAGSGSTFLDIGYHAGVDSNPHAGIRNYNGTTMMTILNTGNVGIGTTSPAAKLDVSGDLIVSGRLRLPNRVSFSAGRNAGWLGLAAGWQAILMDTVLAGNSGGWFSTASGWFTAPVAGSYLCVFNLYMDATANACSTMYVNIGCNASTSGCYGKTGAGGSTHHKIVYTKTNQDSQNQTQIIQLGAGETAGPVVYSSVACTGWYGYHSNFGCALLSGD